MESMKKKKKYNIRLSLTLFWKISTGRLDWQTLYSLRSLPATRVAFLMAKRYHEDSSSGACLCPRVNQQAMLASNFVFALYDD